MPSSAAPGPGEDETLAADFHLFSERGVQGTLAQRVAVPSRNLVPKPASLSFAEAACLPTAYLTAYRMLFNRAGLQPGQSVLVQGAGGGVATAAILIGRAAGLAVYVTSRSEEKRARALELGAAGAVETGRPTARAGRRGARDRRQGDVGPLAEVAAARWHGGRRGRDHRAPTRPPTSPACSGGSSPSSARRWARSSSSTGSARSWSRPAFAPSSTPSTPSSDAHAAFARLEAGDEFGKIVVVP